MIKIHDVVKNIVNADIETKNTLAKGLLNLSSYARSIAKEVSKKSKKEVSPQSIVVALSRIEKKLKAYQYLPTVKISQLSVKKPIVEIVYKNTPENLQNISKVAKLAAQVDNSFLSFSTSTQDIAIVVSEDIKDNMLKIFDDKPRIIKSNLAAVSIRFNHKLVEESGVGFALMQRIASKNITLDEVVSTFNEFTLVFNSKDLPKIIDALEN